MNKIYTIIADPKIAAALIILCQKHPRFKDGKGYGFLDESNYNPFESIVAELTEEGCHSIGFDKSDLTYCSCKEHTIVHYENTGFKKVDLHDFLLFIANDFTLQPEIKIGGNTVEFKENGIQVGCTFVEKDKVKEIHDKLFTAKN